MVSTIVAATRQFIAENHIAANLGRSRNSTIRVFQGDPPPRLRNRIQRVTCCRKYGWRNKVEEYAIPTFLVYKERKPVRTDGPGLFLTQVRHMSV